MQLMDASRGFAKVSAALVHEHDSAGMLVVLLDTCLEVLDADVGGILVEHRGGLEVLAATSHRADELEVHQSQVDDGPCVEAYQTQAGISLTGDDAVVDRWPRFGPRLVAADLASVHASPLRWQGSTRGALGLFRRDPRVFTPDEEAVAQSFTDLAMLLITRSGVEDEVALGERIESALRVRVLVEQAKGVLAEQEELDMETAYDRLLRLARDDHHRLERAATTVLDRAGRSGGS